MVPGWPDDVDLDPADPAPPDSQVSPAPAWADGTSSHPVIRSPAASAPDLFDGGSGGTDRVAFSAAGAFDGGGLRSRLGGFDPGRRGVRALAAVAVVVVLIAALLAWRSRPRVEPVAPPVIDPVATSPVGADEVTASSSAPAAVVVAVGGKVRKPGLVQLPPGARVADALQAAGGASPGVDVAPLNLARKVTDGELIMVGVTLPPGAAPTAPAVPGAAPGAGAGPVNLNTATLADLDTLPGVGPVLAQRILDAREAQGGFKAVADLRKVEGIGAARFEQLKDLVTV